MDAGLRLRNILTLAFITSGTIALFSAKMQNIQWVDEGGIHKRFFHPYMQSFMMFLGEFLCLIAFFIMKRTNPLKYQLETKQAQDQGKPPVPIYLIIVPAVCDFMSSCLQYVALNFIPASIYQMLKGGGIITTFIFSHLLIGGIIKRSQLSGCGFALVGITVVGLAALLFNTSSSTFSSLDIVIGCSLMLISLVANGFFYSFEQRIFKKYYVSPLFMVGMEGLFGMMISAVVISGLTFAPCHFAPKACTFSIDGQAFIERPEQYFRQIGNNPFLLSMVITTVLSIAFLNLIGLTITKHVNALARAILNLTKTALIWIIGIVVTVTVGKNNTDYDWELISWKIIVLESIGFGFLIFATLIYNENIHVKGLSDPPETKERVSLLSQTEEKL